jgi:hypothetical protein
VCVLAREKKRAVYLLSAPRWPRVCVCVEGGLWLGVCWGGGGVGEEVCVGEGGVIFFGILGGCVCMCVLCRCVCVTHTHTHTPTGVPGCRANAAGRAGHILKSTLQQ